MTHRGGGTAILVKSTIIHHSIQIQTSSSEITAIVIEGRPVNLTICSLYMSPSLPIRNHVPDLLRVFRNRSQCLIVGDFNAKHLSWSPTSRNNAADNAIAKLIRTKGFLLTAPNDPTRVTSYGRPSVIDFGLSCGLNSITAESLPDLSNAAEVRQLDVSVSSNGIDGRISIELGLFQHHSTLRSLPTKIAPSDNKRTSTKPETTEFLTSQPFYKTDTTDDVLRSLLRAG
ncbi:RNA-directed DNA polymerase from mobile element jockey [Trichonephila clavata]|uniref:RNA-directed DNA polymerase from mobile element jockey n=1 Tax=Trichonephila clavata TaxID=2740835 RepID=A0A8X6HTT0_TRICU|nr:RNA-directed DNA polymerase from mobile element jockey [Trichonephila clavata]